MIPSISSKIKFEFLDIPVKILALRSCQTQYNELRTPIYEKICESFTIPSDSNTSNPFIPAFPHSRNVASVTNIPPYHFRIRAFIEQMVVIFIVKET